MKNGRIEKNEAVELTDEQLQKTTGGDIYGGDILEFGIYCGTCPDCGFGLKCVNNHTLRMYTDIYCPFCGFTAPDRSWNDGML